MWGTKALLEAHIQECGLRYDRLREDQQSNHAENRSSIASLQTRLEAVHAALAAAQLSSAQAQALREATVSRTDATSYKWAIGILVLIIMGLGGWIGTHIAVH